MRAPKIHLARELAPGRFNWVTACGRRNAPEDRVTESFDETTCHKCRRMATEDERGVDHTDDLVDMFGGGR
jgi:hypothetical protein